MREIYLLSTNGVVGHSVESNLDYYVYISGGTWATCFFRAELKNICVTVDKYGTIIDSNHFKYVRGVKFLFVPIGYFWIMARVLTPVRSGEDLLLSCVLCNRSSKSKPPTMQAVVYEADWSTDLFCALPGRK